MNKMIKNMRKGLKLTQIELSNRADVGLRFIRELEGGKSTVRLDKVQKVLEFFGCHLEVIKNDKNYIPKPLINKYAYGPKWNKKFREEIRKIDNFTCQFCGCTEKEHIEKYKIPLHVHHIDFNKFNNEISNLISLCYFCHAKTNGNKELMQEKCQEIVNKRPILK